MKVVGIIAEYNPFHKGHSYHISEAKKVTGSDFCIVVMSGDYTQRGVPAMIDKYSRTKMALQNGADMVLELPVRFATASAEGFAQGAVSILNATGVVSEVCFGSECGNIDKLTKIANVLLKEPPEYQEVLKRGLRSGLSYPIARNTALQSLDCWDFDTLKILSMPNNILGMEYIKALIKTNSPIKPVTIKRLGGDYNDSTPSELFSSALAIRSSIFSTENLENILSEVPENVYEILKKQQNVSFPIVPNDFSDTLHYKLLREKEKGFTDYVDVNQDLSDRIINNLHLYKDYENFCDVLKTKNMTYARISRCLMHILLDLKVSAISEPSYLRILGINKEATALSKSIKENSTLPLISKMANVKDILSEDAMTLLNEDIFAANLYEMAVSHKFGGELANDYQKQIQVI